ncbi:MAG: tetratricopeptide repeat protein [Salinivenus sp.]
MDRLVAWVRRFVRELRRRRVIRVAVTYATVAFVVLQVGEILIEPFDLPGWTLRLITLALILGFPLAIGLAWVYNVTEEGVVEIEEGGEPSPEETGPADEEAEDREAPSGAEPVAFDVPVARRWFIAGAAAMLALLAALGWGLWPTDATAFEEGDQLVLADVHNETADSLLTGSLTTALRTSLGQSPYLRLYPKTKVNQTLSRMQLGPDTTRVTGPIAREVAVREGVPVVVVPSVSKVGTGYVLGASVYEAGEPDPVGTESVQAESREELLGALDKLSVRLRTLLGESSDQINRFHKPLERVTTSSLEALKLYARANDHHGEGEFKEARRLLRHALKVDSTFTAARAQLGTFELELFDHERGLPLLRQAVKNAENLTEHESFMIRGFYAANVERDFEKAAGLYRTLTELYPNRPAPHNNLARMLEQIGKPEEAAEHYRRALEMDSSDHAYYAGLNSTYLYELGRVDSALALARRRIERDSTYFWAWYHLGWAYLGMDSLEAARRAFERAVEIRPAVKHEINEPLYNLGRTHLLAERYDSAAAAFRRILDLESIDIFGRYGAHYHLGIALQRKGNQEEARAQFREHRSIVDEMVEANPEQPYFRLNKARTLSRLGEEERAWQLALDALAEDSTSGDLRFTMALVAGAQDRDEKALKHLRSAFESGYQNYIFAKSHPDFSGLRGQPQFQALLDSLIHVPGE